MHIPAIDIPNPVYGSNFEAARNYIFSPFRLREENNGAKKEEYNRADLYYVILDENNDIVSEAKYNISPMINQNRKYRFEHNKMRFVVVYETASKLDHEKIYTPIVDLPLSVALTMIEMK